MAQEPVAVVGSACRFAGQIDSPSKLWELVEHPKDLRRKIPKNRFDVDGFYHPDYSYHGHTNVKHAYTLEQDPAAFDAEFFNINALEARAMDPQHRMALETVYEAIEAAGMTIEGMYGSDTCVYAGVMTGDYEAILSRDLDMGPVYAAVGTSRAVLSNRVSYAFNWKGASVTIDTACSSSLVALHNALQTLRSGSSRTAVVLGTNLLLGPEAFIIESNVKMLSPDGRSRMWDKDANGYARGDGVAALVVKPLSAALEDNDHIEGIIRETGVNQDGSTAGLTMPSASSQRDLIRKTFAKAGLDASNPDDQPQYFEAHGTGTPAGDPVEAEAISSAFFGPETTQTVSSTMRKLYVGSIKTVLGHTEGTAGVAGVLKAMLAVQHSRIPPNLLLSELSPAVRPFYKHLQIVQTSTAWPELGPGQARRASINSFGFGGTNAHAIVESYQACSKPSQKILPLSPLTFSASSEKALRDNLAAYIDYLERHEDTDLGDLAYTLRRRSLFQYRVAVSTCSIADLRDKLRDILAGDDGRRRGAFIRTLPKAAGEKPSILGIFTGQGAQYAAMGAGIIRQSSMAKDLFQRLESYLWDLPEQDRPSWSLEAELLAETETSRLTESAIAQPLNTAVQILLVDLLSAAGVSFDAVVGHSSGEIAAAYAAGFLSARAAMYVAYYRGLSCQFARSPNGEIDGAMMAVGTTRADALDLCNDDIFVGRLYLAAVNSPTSVTISGDADAIQELGDFMKDEKKFYRRLQVDRAYHSPHMKPCAAFYANGMKRAGVMVKDPSPSQASCRWYSSVYDGKLVDPSFNLADEYWLQNLISPVMFESALSAAITSKRTTLDAALELGPHPALQGPATQTISEALKKPLPYYGTLDRKTEAVTAFSTALGFLWSHVGKSGINLQQFEQRATGLEESSWQLVKNLPHYQWNHEKLYWAESRRSRHLRTRTQSVHPLLGHITPESGPQNLRWRHILKPREMSWLSGHAVQSQIVFPAAGYVSSAIEASRALTSGDANIQMLELSDFVIHQALPFQDEDDGVEILVELTQIVRSNEKQHNVRAHFSYSAGLGATSGNTDMTLVADAQIHVTLGQPSPTLLPVREEELPHMIDVKPHRLYDDLARLEYNFSGAFRSLTNLRRKRGYARCVAQRCDTSGDCSELWVHPAELDAAFQAVNLAYSYPGDEQLQLLHLPTSISTVRINPSSLGIASDTKEPNATFNIDSTWNKADPLAPITGFSGNARLYFGDEERQHAGIQVDDILLKPVGSMTNERKIFHVMDYVPTKLDAARAAQNISATQLDKEFMQILSRVANFYAPRFVRDVPADSPARTTEGPLKHYLRYCEHLTNELKNGGNQHTRPEWIRDTEQDIMADIERFGEKTVESPDVQLSLFMGKLMPKAFRGEVDILEELRQSGLLEGIYKEGAGLRHAIELLTLMLTQLCDRHPHLRICEIGAGTGSATHTILNTIGSKFDHYTFTDVSGAFLDSAMESFAPWIDHMSFKTLNVETDPVEQGFQEGEFDVVVASQVLHVTRSLGETVRNIRRLLKPGGYLLIGECSAGGIMHYGGSFIFGALPQWWAGVHEGRVLSPFVAADTWDALLRQHGFGGIETMNPPHLDDTYGMLVMAAQAVDDRVEIIRDPLRSAEHLDVAEVLIIGGRTEPVVKVVDELQQILGRLGARVVTFKKLEDLNDCVDNDDAAVICLADLDEPLFKDMTSTRWLQFKRLFLGKKSVLWYTVERMKGETYSNMITGFGRSAQNEEADLRMQSVDLDDLSQLSAVSVAEVFVRFTNKSLIQGSMTELLYAHEREIVLDQQARELVPRIVQLTDANDRLQSKRQVVTRMVDVKEHPVAYAQNKSGRFLRQLTRYEKVRVAEEQHEVLELHVTHAILQAIRTPVGYRALVLGTAAVGRRYLALASAVSSVLNIPTDAVYEVNQDAGPAAELLSLTATRFIALAICQGLCAPQHVVVCGATDVQAKSIDLEAQSRGLKVTFVASECELVRPLNTVTSSWLQLPLYAGASDLKAALDSSSIACFVNFSCGENPIANTLGSLLPAHCRRETFETLCCNNPGAEDTSRSSSSVLRNLLSEASKFDASMQHDQAFESIIALNDIVTSTGNEADIHPLAVIDWTTTQPVPARIYRYDVSMMFKPDKTYWFCGLSGALGIALCDWMIGKGVKNMVISSRNPHVDQRWTADHRRNGVNIQILSCDVTDADAMQRVYKKIAQSLPPVTGVVSAAMVLRDVSVRNMEFGQLQEVVRPKVDGTLNLDRIFHDVDLDFFVVLSSANAIIGNPGQANYAAANMGMSAVATARRRRGLRASTAHIGAIIGVGYVTDSIERLEHAVETSRMIRLSEEDVQQLVVEAIEAGHMDSPTPKEIIMGIEEVSAGDIHIPRWWSDAKFSRMFLRARKGGEEADGRAADESVRDMLQTATTQQDVAAVVRQAFAGQMRKILYLKLSDDEILDTRASDLGLDSLIAVDIRAWVMKTFNVSIPVLQLMSAEARISDLVATTIKDLPHDLTPHIARDETKGDEKVASGDRDGDSPYHSGSSSGSTGVDSVMDSNGRPELDWDKEALPPQNLKLDTVAPRRRARPEVVLLTGATGLLGHHLLQTLVEQTQQTPLRKIIVIAVRRLGERLASGELPPPSEGRIEYYEGDLTSPSFRLTTSETLRIFNEVDAVIHNGADTSHMKYYAALREANVESTRRLVALCAPRKIPLHYISSAGMALASDQDPFPSIAANGTSDILTRDGSYGYACSKWVCERMLEQANAQYGLPVWIHRPSSIIRAGADAATDGAELDWVNTLIAFVHKIQAAPEIVHNQGSFDLVSAQTCCAGIVPDVLTDRPETSKGVTYRNLVGDAVIPMRRLDEIAFQKGFSEPYPKLSWEAWLAKATEAGLQPAVAALLQETCDDPNMRSWPRLLRAESSDDM
ncbi:Polyketide synthase pksF [Teratosphaeria destructans]|uniref:Polyketide synthase pksF n=1 Tax=Teratosphaeria destructans TaxID=418781 RepID=A0A9W7SV32_9PEZI|nr:Polyketide synthase pksF [Teratosphaeria destructans]